MDYGNGKKVTRAYTYGQTFNNNTFKPNRDHYDFVGWKDGKGKAVTSFVVTEKRTLHASWKGKTYTITFGTYDLPDGKETTPKYSKKTVSFQYPEQFNPNGYKLADVGGKYRFRGGGPPTAGRRPGTRTTPLRGLR